MGNSKERQEKEETDFRKRSGLLPTLGRILRCISCAAHPPPSSEASCFTGYEAPVLTRQNQSTRGILVRA